MTGRAEVCSTCGNEKVERPAYPFPVALQAAFGLSFIAFIIFSDRLTAHFGSHQWLWLWSAAQFALGVALVRARMRTRLRVYRCIRCNDDLR